VGITVGAMANRVANGAQASDRVVRLGLPWPVPDCRQMTETFHLGLSLLVCEPDRLSGGGYA
jgi:hypothetical protein